jgi:hypothetical protein
MFHYNWLLDTDGSAKGLNDTCSQLQFALIVAVSIFMLAHTVVLVVTGVAHRLGWSSKKEGASDVHKQSLSHRDQFLADRSYGPSQGRSTWDKAEADLQAQLAASGAVKPSPPPGEGVFTEGQLEKVAHGYANK